MKAVRQRATSYVEVNLKLLGENLAKIKEMANGAKVLPMVKGNAYGNGILDVTRYLAFEQGVETFGVASLGEALTIIDGIPEFTSNPARRIIVFSDTELHNVQLIHHYGKHHGVIPVLSKPKDVAEYLTNPLFAKKEIWLKVNTGMNRMGLDPDALEEGVIPLLKAKGRNVHHLVTHLACADSLLQEDDPTSKQLKTFENMHKSFLDAGIAVLETSVSNSAGACQNLHDGDSTRWIRPGLMLYGPNPMQFPDSPHWRGHQVSRFVTKVLMIRWLKAGQSVGYGVYPVPEDSLIATLPIGYADGFLKFYTGTTVTINGIDGRVHGNICMDTCFVRFPASLLETIPKERWPKEEQEVEIWNHDTRTIQRMADEVGTDTASLVSCLTTRIPRRYVQ